MRCIGERGFALLSQRWRVLQHVTACPQKIGNIANARPGARAVDQYGQVIDVLVSARRDGQAAHRFFQRALDTLKVKPTEVITDAAAVYPAVLDELIPQAWHHIEQSANNPIEADHGRLKHWLRPMRGLRTDRTAAVVIAGHAFVQNLRRGHYELGLDTQPALRVSAAFTELAQAI
jgi:transposase, IS6 family